MKVTAKMSSLQVHLQLGKLSIKFAKWQTIFQAKKKSLTIYMKMQLLLVWSGGLYGTLQIPEAIGMTMFSSFLELGSQILCPDPGPAFVDGTYDTLNTYTEAIPESISPTVKIMLSLIPKR